MIYEALGLTTDNIGSTHVADVGKNRSIYRTLRQLILEGKWSMREPLPVESRLASQWNVSRNTVLAAYDRLLAKAIWRPGPRRVSLVAIPFTNHPTHMSRGLSRCASHLQSKIKNRNLHAHAISPQPADVRLFPFDQWNRCRTRALRAGGVGLLDYQSRYTLGLPSLRHQIAEYLNHSRGVSCDWQQVVIPQRFPARAFPCWVSYCFTVIQS